MTVTSTPVFSQAINNGVQTIANGDGTTAKTLVTAGANGTRVYALLVTSTDTSNRDLVVNFNTASTNYQIATVQIPLSSGTANNVVTVDVLRAANFPGLAYDAWGNRYIDLAANNLITIAAGSTVTSGKTITAFAYGSNL